MKKRALVPLAAVAGVFACLGIANAAGLIGADASSSKEEAVAERLRKRQAVEIETATMSRRGPRGPRGFKGATGPQGPKGTIGTITAVKSSGTFLCGWEAGACSVGSTSVTCPPGTVSLGGGYSGAGIRA